MESLNVLSGSLQAGSFQAVWLLAQVDKESWLVKWGSPFFLVGLGILAGVLLLTLFVGLFKVLSKVPAWEGLSHNPAGHIVAGIITLLVPAISWMIAVAYGFGGIPQPEEAGLGGLIKHSLSFISGTENLLITLAVLLLSAIFGWSLVYCAGRKSADTLWSTLSEGAAGVLSLLVVLVMIIGLSAGFLFKNRQSAIESIPRLFQTGTYVVKKVIPGAPADIKADESPLVPVELSLDPELLNSISIQTDRSIVLADAALASDFVAAPQRMQPGDVINWNKKEERPAPIPIYPNRKLHIQNRELEDATVQFTISTRPAVPEAATILITAVIIFLSGLTVLLQQAVAPRASAVALATIKNELAQPLFLVILLLGIFCILLFEFLSFYTLGEDIKLLKECGIVVIMLLAAFQGIWSASSSISEEIEGRTALTVMSKPIQRRSFVIGKFLGIFWIVALIFVILGTVELFAVAYKPIYEAKENSLEVPPWQECHREMIATVPGLVLGLMQATVLSSISVALATRLPQLANIAVCFAIYVVGHLATTIVSAANEGFPIVNFFAQLISTIVPILEHFQMQAAIDAGSPIPMSLLSGSLIYCLLYIILSMFLALLLFEDRDLA